MMAVAIAVADARQLLGSVADKLNDAEVEVLVVEVQAVAEGLVAAFIRNRENSRALQQEVVDNEHE